MQITALPSDLCSLFWAEASVQVFRETKCDRTQLDVLLCDRTTAHFAASS